jgi:hypothetical protein
MAHSDVPGPVLGLSSNVLSIAAGYGGVLQCWGWNKYRQLGNGTRTDSNTPVDVCGLSSGARAVSVAGDHSCALLDSGITACWGYDLDGEVSGYTPQYPRPVVE